MLKLSCLRIFQILGRLTSISTLQPQTTYVTPETTFPCIRNLGPLGGSKLPMDIAMPSVLETSLSVTAGNRLCHMSRLSWLCDGFRPILGNPMEVTHVTSLGHVYIFPC